MRDFHRDIDVTTFMRNLLTHVRARGSNSEIPKLTT